MKRIKLYEELGCLSVTTVVRIVPGKYVTSLAVSTHGETALERTVWQTKGWMGR